MPSRQCAEQSQEARCRSAILKHGDLFNAPTVKAESRSMRHRASGGIVTATCWLTKSLDGDISDATILAAFVRPVVPVLATYEARRAVRRVK